MWIGLASLYSFDETILDGLIVPDGVDRNTLIFNLLAETAELELLYPDADFMKELVRMWSAKELPIWERMYNTTKLEYNPIENYDRIEEWTDENHGNALSTVAAFNSTEMVDSAGGETDTNSIHKGRTHGNIGVTTSQQMIEAERNVSQFNIIDYIVERFKNRFCILVY